MKFTKIQKNQNPADGKKYAVYMNHENKEHYVCDMIDGSAAEDIALNELGLTLRARLIRSKGKYAMLEGTIFNPSRLLEAACEITDFQKEDFIGGDYKNGYTLLTVTADGCVNKYMIFNKSLADLLTKDFNARLKT